MTVSVTVSVAVSDCVSGCQWLSAAVSVTVSVAVLAVRETQACGLVCYSKALLLPLTCASLLAKDGCNFSARCCSV